MKRLTLTLGFLALVAAEIDAQDPRIRYGRGVPSAVRSINARGLKYLAATQTEKGDWPGDGAGSGSGVTGICVMAFMASGQDPDFGPYAENIRRAVRRLIIDQDPKTGHITGGSRAACRRRRAAGRRRW